MPQIYMIFFKHKHFGQRNYTAPTFFYILLDSWFNKNPYLRRNFQSN